MTYVLWKGNCDTTEDGLRGSKNGSRKTISIILSHMATIKKKVSTTEVGLGEIRVWEISEGRTR